MASSQPSASSNNDQALRTIAAQREEIRDLRNQLNLVNEILSLGGTDTRKLEELKSQLSHANSLIELHRTDEQKLKERVRALQEALKQHATDLARLHKADAFVNDVMILETDPDFAELRTAIQEEFPLGNILAQVLSGDRKEADKALEEFHTLLECFAAARIVQTPTVTIEQVAPVAATLSQGQIAKLVDEANEDRIRAISRDLYERSLSLPRVINALYDEFVLNRTRFQHLVSERDIIMDDLIQRRIDAQLTPARSLVERTYPIVEVNALALFTQLVQFGRAAQIRLDEIERELVTLSSTFDTIRNQYHEHSTGAADIRASAEDAKRMTAKFGLPCPAEIAHQFNETIQRLLLVNIETDQGRRLQNMLAFQPYYSDRAKVIKDFFENLLSAEVFLFRFNKAEPEELFTDNPKRLTALTRLLLITADAINKLGAEKFKAKNTIVSVLQKSGLLHEINDDVLKDLMDLHKHLFEIHRVNFFYVWEPLAECRTCAKEATALLKNSDVVLEGIKRGLQQHHAEKYAAKAGSDTGE